MCEILFRGKRKDNGELVYGYYAELPVGSLGAAIFSNDDEIVCEDTASYIIKVFEKQHSNYSNGNPLLVIECENYEVIPETVGQYTGFTDKNGKRIFEGDIIRKTNEGRHPKIFTANIHTDFRVNEEVYYGPCEHFTESCEYEIIGNIHDNPELLKGGEK